MTTEDLVFRFDSFNNFKILIIGDVMIDTYLWGKVDRISPEAPVPIVSCNKRENRLGGAANVALNVQSLGAKPILASIIGKDDHCSLFFDLMDEKSLTVYGIHCDHTRKTTTKTRIISQSQQLIRVDDEITNPVSPELEKTFIQHIRRIINNHDIHAIIFQDYDKGVITPLIIQEIVAFANEKNIPTLADPKKRNFLNYKDISFFKPNFKELTEGLKTDIKKGDFETLNKVASKFLNDQNFSMIMITLSELGVFIRDSKHLHKVPAVIRDIADVSGAGDTVISTVSLCLAAGLDMKDIAIISNLAGGIVCEKVGVVPVNKEQLLNETIQYYLKNK